MTNELTHVQICERGVPPRLDGAHRGIAVQPKRGRAAGRTRRWSHVITSRSLPGSDVTASLGRNHEGDAVMGAP